MYFIIGIPLLFGFNKYIIPTFSFVPILFSESSVGLCITAVSILLVVGTYKLSIQKILSEKLALILSLIQFFMIPWILALESNFIVLMQDVISVFLSLFFRNAQIGTFQMFLILVLIGYPFAVLRTIRLHRVNKAL